MVVVDILSVGAHSSSVYFLSKTLAELLAPWLRCRTAVLYMYTEPADLHLLEAHVIKLSPLNEDLKRLIVKFVICETNLCPFKVPKSAVRCFQV